MFTKLIASLPALASLALVPVVCAQTVATDPLGCITLPIAAPAVAGAAQFSFRGLGLARPVEDQGVATSVGANSITATGSAWTDNLFNGSNGAYFVEIIGPTGGAGIGTTYDITATSGGTKTISLAQNLASGLAANATFRIRKHWTIASVFGAADESGLLGGTATSADTIQVLNALNQTYQSYYYSTLGGPGVGWRKVGGGAAPQDATAIYPDDGLLITHKTTTPLGLVLMGAVKTGQTSFPIFAGLNILANPYATPMSLASSGLYTGSSATGLAGGTASTADLVLIFNGTTYDTYFYSTAGGPGIGWRQVGQGAADATDVPLAVGSAFLVQRRSGAAFDWVSPQHPSTPGGGQSGADALPTVASKTAPRATPFSVGKPKAQTAAALPKPPPARKPPR